MPMISADTSDLIKGWTGPCEVFIQEEWLPGIIRSGSPIWTARNWTISLKDTRLSLDRAEVRDHIVRWADGKSMDISWARDIPEALAWAVERIIKEEPVLGLSGPWHGLNNVWTRRQESPLPHRSAGELLLLVRDNSWFCMEPYNAGLCHSEDHAQEQADDFAMKMGWWLAGGPFKVDAAT